MKGIETDKLAILTTKIRRKRDQAFADSASGIPEYRYTKRGQIDAYDIVLGLIKEVTNGN